MDSPMMPTNSAQYWIEKLNMTAHPEGGWFTETFRDDRKVKAVNLKGEMKEYAASTAIYFLLDDQSFSAFHRIGAAEAWHFYAGTGITIYSIDEAGNLKTVELGANPEIGQTHSTVIPAGVWFASRVNQLGGFALCGCTVAPGFEFEEFELAAKNDLISRYPIHKNVIVGLTL
jgi:predicted cupin superfamily sugar epimerase